MLSNTIVMDEISAIISQDKKHFNDEKIQIKYSNLKDIYYERRNN